MKVLRTWCVAVVVLGALHFPSVALAGSKIFNFDTGDYGTADSNCVNNPSPPVFNRPEYGSQSAAYIVDPTGCGNGSDGGNNGSDSLLTSFFSSSSSNSNEVRFSWVDPSNDDTWLRLIAFNASTVTPVYQRPTVDIRPGSSISIKVLVFGEDATGTPRDVSAGLEFGLAIRETGRNLPLGADGGTAGPVEYVGFDSKGGGTDANSPNGGVRIAQTDCPSTGCAGYFHTIKWTVVDTTHVDVSVDGGSPVSKLVVNFAGDGVLSAAYNRAALDSLIIRKPADDDVTKKWFVNIDDIDIEAPGVIDPVQVLGAPILESITSVTVGSINTDDPTPPSPDGAEVVHLYLNGVDVAGSPASPPYTTATTQVFGGLTLHAGDVLTATQVIGGVESALSEPVTVISAAAYTENFDSYANQAAFAAAWPSVNTLGPDIIVQTATVHTCSNAIQEQGTTTSGSLIRRYHDLNGLTGYNGSDVTPMWITWYFYHGAHASQRNYMEVRRYSSGDPGTGGSLAKLWAFGCYNTDDHLTFSGTKYQMRDVNGAGALAWSTLTAGPSRVNNAWNKMQMKIRAADVTFYVNDTLAQTIPRVGDAGNINVLVIGSGLSNSNTAAYYDSVSISFGDAATDPFSAPPVPQVAVQGPLASGQTSVTVTGVSTAVGTNVLVFDMNTNAQIGATTPANGNSTVVVTVPALVAAHTIKAIQKLVDNTQSCPGPGITVNDCNPVPTVAVNNGPLTPTSTSVRVTNTSASATVPLLVKVYKVVAGTPTFLASATATAATVDVPIPAASVAKGDIVSATQTINTIEGCVVLSGANTAVVGSGTNKGILLTLGIRESTATTGTIGADGSTLTGLGLIEWIFPAGSVAPAPGSAAPQGKLIPLSQDWQTVTFDPTKADGSQVNGSGLTAAADTDHTWAGTYGVLEHLAITQNGADTGPYVLYVDNVMNGTTLVDDFETPAGPPANTQVMFRQPTFSGTTSGNILALPSISFLSADHGDASAQSDKIQWQFKTEATTRWVRVTTSGTANRPSPVVSLTQPITMRVLLLPAIVCNTPRVDFDNDDDVDMIDFSFFQKCFSPATAVLSGCDCADVNNDGKVDASDFGDPLNPQPPTFVGCASRANVKSPCAP